MLQLVVINDPPFLQVDEKHLARLEPPFANDIFGGDLEHSRFRAHDHDSVVRDVYRLGRSPLRSSTAPTNLPSVKPIEAGPSHGSIRQVWYL